MDDDEPPTQPFDDPRRVGRNNSGLSDKDLADVVCILHPASSAAMEDVAQLAKGNPQHILQNADLLGAALLPVPLGSRDIALRLSAKVKDPSAGFKFGRNPRLCDVVLGKGDGATRVSQTHFRIFLTEHDILMIQDMSRNGTVVDNVLLSNTIEGYHHSRTLSNGSMVTLGLMKNCEEEIKFAVRIPSRSGYEDAYEDNLRDYQKRVSDAREKRKDPKGNVAVPNTVSIARAHGEACLGQHQNAPTID